MIKTLFDKSTTNIIKGFAALSIVFFHIGVAYKMPDLFNFWGGIGVAIFLILSGFGINESFKEKGLNNFWQKKFYRIGIPYLIVALLSYSFISQSTFETFVKDTLFLTSSPSLWFIGHILKCYIVYYLAQKFFPKYIIPIFIVFGLIILNFSFQLEAEQAFSFLFGMLISRYRNGIEDFTKKRITKICLICAIVGLIFMLTKIVPEIHSLKGIIIYNYFNLFARLPWAICTLIILYYFKINSWKLLNPFGKCSLEIYLVHIPLLFLIDGTISGLLLFISGTTTCAFIMYLIDNKIIKQYSLINYIYIGVNALIVLKYLPRITQYPIELTWIYIILMFSVLHIINRYSYLFNKIHKNIILITIFATIVIIVGLQYYINPYSLQIDRWSAINNWIRNLFNGEFPYAAQTHLNGYGSPFPFWQIFHIPYYFFNNVGLSFIVCLIVFLWTTYKIYGKSKSFYAFIILIISPAIWYEIAVRSDFATNFILACAIINYIQYKNIKLGDFPIAIGIVCGLMTSTRLFALTPFVILFFAEFLKLPISKMIIVLFTTIITFALTFFPLILWDREMLLLFEYNPFTLQTRQMHVLDLIWFIIIGCYLALTHRREQIQYNRNTSLMLVFIVAISFLHKMYRTSNWDLFSIQYDITYLNSIMPFTTLAMLGYDANNIHLQDKSCK